VTFSDEKVIQFVNRHFTAAWESVAPVSLATFELGEGKKLTGAYGGNIALYACDSEGRVLDILPALQSPSVTLQWLEEVRKLNELTRGMSGADKRAAISHFHETRAIDPEAAPEVATRAPAKAVAPRFSDAPPAYDPATETLEKMVLKTGAVKYTVKKKPVLERKDTAALREMVGKSMAMPRVQPGISEAPRLEEERIVVVIAGGLRSYRQQIDARLAAEPLKNPDAYRSFVFETVLHEKLSGRSEIFVTDDPVSIALPD
jgi:hypothetical protein